MGPLLRLSLVPDRMSMVELRLRMRRMVPPRWMTTRVLTARPGRARLVCGCWR